MIATVSPRLTPSRARPPATASTRPSSSAQVSETLSSAVRTATTSGWLAAVRRNASATVCASTARAPTGVIVLLSIVPPLFSALIQRPAETIAERDKGELQGGAQRTLKPDPLSVEMSLVDRKSVV